MHKLNVKISESIFFNEYNFMNAVLWWEKRITCSSEEHWINEKFKVELLKSEVKGSLKYLNKRVSNNWIFVSLKKKATAK